MLAIGCDHGGFLLKKDIINYLNKVNLKYIDFGTNSIDSVDYPEYACKVAKAVSNGTCNMGILLCGTGIGMSIAANKVKNIRAVVGYDEFTTKISRKHNDANVLCLGGRIITKEIAIQLVNIFINTTFDGGRHLRRIKQISQIELDNLNTI